MCQQKKVNKESVGQPYHTLPFQLARYLEDQRHDSIEFCDFDAGFILSASAESFEPCVIHLFPLDEVHSIYPFAYVLWEIPEVRHLEVSWEDPSDVVVWYVVCGTLKITCNKGVHGIARSFARHVISSCCDA